MLFKGQKNFCIAPFIQITLSPTGRYSPCPEIGGRPWKESEAKPIKMWNSEEFVSLRKEFVGNQQSKICDRCWKQESFGGQSLRRRLFANHPYDKKGLVDFINIDHQSGPKQINIMVGNKCNLRCRICSASSSVTWNVEGKYYKDTYKKESASRYISNIKKPIEFSLEQIEEIYQMSNNVERIEFYGGEPLLDKPTLVLLEKLVASGRSQDIVLFYNTNMTIRPSTEQLNLWRQFKNVELNLSMDDVGDRFTYNRYPGKWQDVDQFVNSLDRTFLSPMIITTVSVLNIFYLPEITNQADKYNIPVFFNTLHNPDYYDIRYLPEDIKVLIKNRIETNIEKHWLFKVNNLLNMLDSKDQPNYFEEMSFWIRAKDKYRSENFKETFPEYYSMIASLYPDFLNHG